MPDILACIDPVAAGVPCMFVSMKYCFLEPVTELGGGTGSGPRIECLANRDS